MLYLDRNEDCLAHVRFMDTVALAPTGGRKLAGRPPRIGSDGFHWHGAQVALEEVLARKAKIVAAVCR